MDLKKAVPHDPEANGYVVSDRFGSARSVIEFMLWAAAAPGACSSASNSLLVSRLQENCTDAACLPSGAGHAANGMHRVAREASGRFPRAHAGSGPFMRRKDDAFSCRRRATIRASTSVQQSR
jgi:hypothetical protein